MLPLPRRVCFTWPTALIDARIFLKRRRLARRHNFGRARGGSEIFLWRGCTTKRGVPCLFFFFYTILLILESRRSSRRGVRRPYNPGLEGLDPPLKRSITGALAARIKGSPLTVDPVRLILLDDTDYELEKGGLRIQPEQTGGEDRAK